MEFLYVALQVIQCVLLIYFTIATIYFAAFSIAGLFKCRRKALIDNKIRKFAVLIPGYKEDAVIIDVARQALEQDYPRTHFDVIVIADSFQPETLEGLRQLPIRVQEVSFEKSSKSRALNKTMSLLPDIYDAVIILDADNVMEHNFITLMNEALSMGYSAVQGHRTSKNRNTSFAILDSVSEEINNHIFRKGHRVLGLSSALIGSGMAFDYQMYKAYMATIDSFGEDKELEIKLLKDRRVIEYRDDAIVYDEKVQKSKVFMVQRTRWLANQIIYARSYFLSSLRELLVNRNVDYFDKVFQQMLPPRIFLMGFLVILTLLSILFNPLSLTVYWLILTFVTVLTLLISAPRRYYNAETLKAMLLLPQGFLFMIGSLFRIFKAKKSFGATAHSVQHPEKNKKQ